MAKRAVSRLLLGERAGSEELPSLHELVAALTALATGRKRKVLLPLAEHPAELALERRGERVLVSLYSTSATPDVFVLRRPVALRTVLDVVAHATLEIARVDEDPTSQAIAARLAERALATAVERDVEATDAVRSGGVEDPARDEVLSFSWEASFAEGDDTRTTRADVHALLFHGALVATLRGKRLLLLRGPILLAVQRMLAAASASLTARDAGRCANVRLRLGAFHVGLRTTKEDGLTLSLGGEDRKSASASGLSHEEVVAPMLKLASELLRALVAADRTQSRNLRVRALREELRTLRKALRSPRTESSFLNLDPDRLRFDAGTEPSTKSAPVQARGGASSLRFGERWRVAVDGLDANGTFLCGDRLVISTARHNVALGRDDGTVLWVRPADDATCHMAGSVLVRLFPNGHVELCDVRDGEPFAETRIGPRNGHTSAACAFTGGNVPPTVVLTEGEGRLVAIDLRTAEPRWRVATRGTLLPLVKSGRILIAATTDGRVRAIDVATGESVWCVATGARFTHAPSLARDNVLVASSGGSDGVSSLHALDLFSGAERERRTLANTPASSPVPCEDTIFVATSALESAAIEAFSLAGLEPRFTIADPGLGSGGVALAFDDRLVVNAPGGRLVAIDRETGALSWSHRLADPAADDVPRRLEPVLRGGALFVPASSVHVVRPSDGTLSVTLPCDLVPDLLRVDERGWVYVAEESGHVAAYAPVAHLTLIRGGK